MSDQPEGERRGTKPGSVMTPGGPHATVPKTLAMSAEDLISRMSNPDIAMTEALEAMNAAEDPLGFFLAVMKAPAMPFPYRFEAAKQAAPFVHAKPIAKQGATPANPSAIPEPKKEGDEEAFAAVLGRRGPGRPRLVV